MSFDEKVSCFLNRLCGGDGGQTLCSRLFLCADNDWRIWLLTEAINAAFRWKEDDHCQRAFRRHLERTLRRMS